MSPFVRFAPLHSRYSLHLKAEMYANASNCAHLIQRCIEEFIRHCMHHNALQQFNTIIYEQDFPETCNYEWVAKVLSQNGMTRVRHAFHTVWVRRAFKDSSSKQQA